MCLQKKVAKGNLRQWLQLSLDEIKIKRLEKAGCPLRRPTVKRKKTSRKYYFRLY